MDLQIREFFLFLCVFCVGYYRKTEGYRLCTLHGKATDNTSCSASLGSSPACLVCPISRLGQQGLSWKSSNETLFIDTVRLRGDLKTYAVNECGPDNYTLSVSTKDLSNGGKYTCSLGMTTLAQFNLIIKDLKPIIPNTQLCVHDFNNKGDNPCKVVLHSSPVCLVCPIKREGLNSLSWKYSSNLTLFLGEVRVGKMFNTSVNQCGHENYSLSLLPDNVGDGGHFTCSLGETPLARFNVIIMAVTPVLQIFWNETRVDNPFEIYDKSTVEARCEVSNLKLPVTLSWEVDNQEIFSKEVWREPLQISKIHNMTGSNATDDAFYNPTQEVCINFNFTPTDNSHTIGCVVRGPLVFGRKASVLLVLKRKIEKDKYNSYSLMIWIVILLPIVSLVAFCVISMRKVVISKKTVASSGGHSERITETPQSRQDYIPEEMFMAENAPDYDIYYGTDNSESLSNFVRLINRISENGRLERWVGELSAMVYDKDNCVATTYNDDASETDISEFRTMAMHVKDVVNHDNVAEIIGIEVSKEPFYIYTEHIEMGTLKDFLNDLQSSRVDPNSYLGELLRFSKEISSALVYLQSAELSHPAICCEKVLLTEGGTCKVYDFQSYPVPETIIAYIVLKHERSCTNWKLAPETRLKKEHSFKSDSWSLSAFICEVYSMGTDPCKASRNSLYEVPANYYDVSFRRPHLCPDSIYSTLKFGWNMDKTERPDIETIYKSLTAMNN
ncbi:Fibroblast growth factor receptor 3 [Holothuria leucospilota]|uniref:Fibroblast growth factor receptor 3 n=1 Tax=Holothuria leucospilota TaxID=206669 RepID=A0A9Q1H7M7_HOLLE|nr:Fibroblast growth factor receptor 3 [Holothuria leucospilota]